MFLKLKGLVSSSLVRYQSLTIFLGKFSEREVLVFLFLS